LLALEGVLPDARGFVRPYALEAEAALFNARQQIQEVGIFWHGHDGSESGVNYAAFSPDGQMVLTQAQDGKVRLWNVESGKQTQSLSGHEGGLAAPRSVRTES
jgi:WD40 repeat protein